MDEFKKHVGAGTPECWGWVSCESEGGTGVRNDSGALACVTACGELSFTKMGNLSLLIRVLL